MFYSIREEASSSEHSVWREEAKIAGDKLSFQEAFKVLSFNMLDYDTMQVKWKDGTWVNTIWNGVEVRNHYRSLTSEPEDLYADWI